MFKPIQENGKDFSKQEIGKNSFGTTIYQLSEIHIIKWVKYFELLSIYTKEIKIE